MAKARRKKTIDPSPLAADSARKCCFTLSPRADQLLSAKAKKLRITRSKLANDLILEEFKGVSIRWIGEAGGEDESAA